MSKLRVNNNIGEFLNRNKFKITAITLAAAWVVGITCGQAFKNHKQPNQVEASLYKLNEEDLMKIKSNVEKNIDNIDAYMIDDNKAYHIVERKFKENPIYGINENNELYLVKVDSEYMGIVEYDILYTDAIYLGIDELLQSRLKGHKMSKV